MNKGNVSPAKAQPKKDGGRQRATVLEPVPIPVITVRDANHSTTSSTSSFSSGSSLSYLESEDSITSVSQARLDRMFRVANDLNRLLDSINRKYPELLPEGHVNLRERHRQSRLNENIFEILARHHNASQTSTLFQRNINKEQQRKEDVEGKFILDGEIANKSVYEGDGDRTDEKTQSSSAWRRGLTIFLFILGILILSHLASFIFLITSKELSEHPYLCKTENCKYLSEWILEGMDNRINPCDDFYQFACGKFVTDNPSDDTEIFRKISEAIPFSYETNAGLGRMLHRVDSYPLNQVLTFYQACIDQETRNKFGYEPLVNLLLQLNLLNPIKYAKMDVSRTIVRIFKRLNKLAFIDIYSGQQNYVLVKLGTPEKEYTVVDPMRYQESMRKAFILLQDELKIKDIEEIDTIVYQIIWFEAELTTIQSKDTVQIFGFPDRLSQYVKVPKQFHPNYDADELGKFTFGSVVSELFDQTDEITIFFNYVISIINQEERFYILYLEELINRTPQYVIFRYLQWVIIKQLAFDLTTDLEGVMMNIFPWVGQIPAEKCIRNLFNRLNVLAATRYAKELSDQANLDKNMEGMIAAIGATLVNLTKVLPRTIMDSFQDTFSTFSLVQTKISELEPFLKVYYPNLDIKMDTHFENLLQATELSAGNSIKKLQNIPPFHNWPPGEYSVDDVTITVLQRASKAKRFLNIPFGALQVPYMGNDLPVFNYAGFGFWIASYYLIYYPLKDLLELHAKEREVSEPEISVIPQKRMEVEMLPRLECILHQYDRVISMDKEEYQIKPNTEFSRLKNFAFVTALELIMNTLNQKTKNFIRDHVDESTLNFTAAKNLAKKQILPGLEKYTPEQLFFIGIARHTCIFMSDERKVNMKEEGATQPGYRVNAALRNSIEFSDAFQCSGQRFMNPKRKCAFLAPRDQSYDMEIPE